MTVKLISPVEQEWIKKLRKHANENYEKGGWDYLVECYSDEDIVEYFCEGKTTYSEVLAEAKETMNDKDEYRQDIINSAW